MTPRYVYGHAHGEGVSYCSGPLYVCQTNCQCRQKSQSMGPTRLAARHVAFSHLHEVIEEIDKELCVRFDVFRQLVQPAQGERFQSEIARLQVYHATPTDGSRRGHRQIRHLKHHRHWLEAKNNNNKNTGRFSKWNMHSMNMTRCRRYVMHII